MMDRPDLTQVSDEILAYIEALEAEIETLKNQVEDDNGREDKPFEPSEPPTTINIISLSKEGYVKRTPRHLYSRQKRGGMGIFDLDTSDDDYPFIITAADIEDTLVILTDYARIYHLPVKSLDESPVRARGTDLYKLAGVPESEKIVHISALRKKDEYLAMLTFKGYVRTLRYNYLNLNVRSGTQMVDVGRFGPLVQASWTSPEDDIFITTRTGLAIRFSAKRLHPNGSLGIRIDKDDEPVAVVGVTDQSNVLLLSADGKGTLRQMSGFRANKAAGAGGKIALKTEELIAAHTTKPGEDIFVISKLSKIIRFAADEIPPKEGVVQGVNCMALRADKCIAVTSSG